MDFLNHTLGCKGQFGVEGVEEYFRSRFERPLVEEFRSIYERQNPIGRGARLQRWALCRDGFRERNPCVRPSTERQFLRDIH